MKSLLQHIRQNTQTPPDLALVIGAGNGTSLPALRQLDSARLVLAEAHPRQAEELARRARTDLGEEVWHQAITATAQGNVTLHVLNNPNYNSLKSPAGLLTYFPNLRAISNLEAPSRTLTESITALSPAEGDDNLLILDAPGQAFELLQATSPSALQSFAWIIINGATETLYSEDSTAAESAFLLQKLGFDPVSEDQEAVYPHTALLLARNPSRVQTYRLDTEIRQLHEQFDESRRAHVHEAEDYQQKLDQLGQHSDEQTRQLSELQNQLDTLASEKAELINARDALNKDKAALASARDEQTKLAAERQTQFDALTGEKAQLIAARDALSKDNAALTAARDEQTKLANERKAQLDALTGEKAQFIAARDALSKDNAALTAARDEQTKLANERKAQLTKTITEREQSQKAVSEHQENLKAAHQHIQTLEANAEETVLRQQLLQEELIKAEAQIELIKDLLLREAGL